MVIIAVGITLIATETADTEATYQYAVALMGGNAARWMDRLEAQGNAPNSFLEFKKLSFNQYTPLDDKKNGRDKLQELQ